MDGWVVKTACGYKVLTYSGDLLTFFAIASQVKSYIHGKAFTYINLCTPKDKLNEYESATGTKYVDYTQSGNF